MKNKEKIGAFRSFSTLYVLGITFVGLKLINYLQWTFKLVRNWDLPGEPFFSKVNLINSTEEISITAYLIFAIAYIIIFGFIILGLYQLNETVKLFDQKRIFHNEVSIAFRKSGKSFLFFAFGTLLIDIVFLIWAKTSNMLTDLLSTELYIFLIIGYLMFFLSDVFKEGVHIREENDLTI